MGLLIRRLLWGLLLVRRLLLRLLVRLLLLRLLSERPVGLLATDVCGIVFVTRLAAVLESQIRLIAPVAPVAPVGPLTGLTGLLPALRRLLPGLGPPSLLRLIASVALLTGLCLPSGLRVSQPVSLFGPVTLLSGLPILLSGVMGLHSPLLVAGVLVVVSVGVLDEIPLSVQTDVWVLTHGESRAGRAR